MTTTKPEQQPRCVDCKHGVDYFDKSGCLAPHMGGKCLHLCVEFESVPVLDSERITQPVKGGYAKATEDSLKRGVGCWPECVPQEMLHVPSCSNFKRTAQPSVTAASEAVCDLNCPFDLPQGHRIKDHPASGGEGEAILCSFCLTGNHKLCDRGDYLPCKCPCPYFNPLFDPSVAPTPAPEPVEGKTPEHEVLSAEWLAELEQRKTPTLSIGDTDYRDSNNVGDWVGILKTERDAICTVLRADLHQPSRLTDAEDNVICAHCGNSEPRDTAIGVYFCSTECFNEGRFRQPLTDAEKVEVAEIEARLNAATPENGTWQRGGDFWDKRTITDGHGKTYVADCGDNIMSDRIAEFIASSPVDIRRLLQLLVRKG